MTAHSIGNALLFFFSVMCLWYFFFFMYRELTVDVFRHKLFELRDQLFDEAANGVISFDHPAYLVLRNTMNGFLRFGHKVSLLEIVVAATAIGMPQLRKRKSFAAAWREASQTLSPEQKERLSLYRCRINELLVMQSFFGSPFFVFFLLVGLVMMRGPSSLYQYARSKTLALMNSIMEKPLEEIESAAMAYGGLQ